MNELLTADQICEIMGLPSGSFDGTPLEHRRLRRDVVEQEVARRSAPPWRLKKGPMQNPDGPEPRSWVYFVRRSDGLVKIGRSTNPERRLRHLIGAGGPMDMVAWFDGGAETERELHRRFAGERAVGEWFYPTDVLDGLIKTHRRSTSDGRSLSTAEVAERLRVSRTTVWRLVQTRKLNPVRITPRTTLYDADEVERLADSDPDENMATLKAAYSHMAERHAEDERPMCTGCGRRRAPKSGALCGDCEEVVELDRRHKLAWWHRNHPKRATIAGKRVYLKPGETPEQAAARVAS